MFGSSKLQSNSQIKRRTENNPASKATNHAKTGWPLCAQYATAMLTMPLYGSDDCCESIAYAARKMKGHCHRRLSNRWSGNRAPMTYPVEKNGQASRSFSPLASHIRIWIATARAFVGIVLSQERCVPSSTRMRLVGVLPDQNRMVAS